MVVPGARQCVRRHRQLRLTYTASLADGSPLPPWLRFDEATATFSGTPPLDFTGSIDLKVTAKDGTLGMSVRSS